MGDVEGLSNRALNQGIPRLLERRIQEASVLKERAMKLYDRLVELGHKEGVPQLVRTIHDTECALNEARHAENLLDPFASGGITDASRENATTALKNLEEVIKRMNAHGIRNAA